jgi:adenosylcobinamide-phosphate guanylyltransferase
MGVIALIMAGGKAARMASGCEKPLLKICGKAMVKWVIEALRDSKNIDDILVSVSKFTPETAELMRNLSIKVVETPGDGFIPDVQHVVEKRSLFSPLLTVSADLPLITGELIDEIVTYYQHCGKPALAVVVPLETYEQLGLTPERPFRVGRRYFAPVGINLIDGRHIDNSEMAQEIFVIEKTELAINVNTPRDLEIAERLLRKTSRRKPTPTH